MVWASFIGLLVLIRYIKGIKQIKDFKKQTINIDFLFSIMLNLIMSWGWIIDFGRPYSPGFVYLIGVFVAGLVGVSLPGLIEWMEKLAVILSMLSLASEYFIIGIQHWRRTNQKKQKEFWLSTVLFFSFIFLFILNCVHID
jgi:hypothetical protein